MSTETQKVDVLDALDRQIDQTRRFGGSPSYNTMKDVRDAVAELIESTSQLIETVEPILTDHGYVYVGKLQKAKRALARVGGAA